MMRVLLKFQHREKWHVSFLAEDVRTPAGRSFTLLDTDTLLRAVEKLGGDPERARIDVCNWGRVSVFFRRNSVEVTSLISVVAESMP